jgi:hypothetical protein
MKINTEYSPVPQRENTTNDKQHADALLVSSDYEHRYCQADDDHDALAGLHKLPVSCRVTRENLQHSHLRLGPTWRGKSRSQCWYRC